MNEIELVGLIHDQGCVTSAVEGRADVVSHTAIHRDVGARANAIECHRCRGDDGTAWLNGQRGQRQSVAAATLNYSLAHGLHVRSTGAGASAS